MRKIILFLLPVLLYFTSSGQTTPPATGTPSTLNRFAGGIRADSVIILPIRDTTLWLSTWGNLTIQPQTGMLLYRSNGAWHNSSFGLPVDTNFIRNQNSYGQIASYRISGEGQAFSFFANDGVSGHGDAILSSGNATSSGVLILRQPDGNDAGFIGSQVGKLYYNSDSGPHEFAIAGVLKAKFDANGIEVPGRVKQGNALSSMLKADASGVIVSALPTIDFVTPGQLSDSLTAAQYTGDNIITVNNSTNRITHKYQSNVSDQAIYPKVQVDSFGHVILGMNLIAGDIPNILQSQVYGLPDSISDHRADITNLYATKADDNTVLHITGNETVVSGIKVFNQSPWVPTPTISVQAANKEYVDNQITGVDTTFIPLSQKGAPNGVAPLGPGSKIDVAYLPATLMIYKGVWSAAANMPTLADGVGISGWVYKANDDAIVNFGSHTDTIYSGDWVIYNGTLWQRTNNSDLVTSVNGQQGIVSLTTDHIPEGLSNLYFTNARARSSVSASGDLSYNATTGVFSYTTPAGLPPTGSAGGDLSGSYPNPSVVDNSHNHTISTLTGIQDSLNARIPVTSYNQLNQNFSNTDLSATSNRDHDFGNYNLNIFANKWTIEGTTDGLHLAGYTSNGIVLNGSPSSIYPAYLKTDSIAASAKSFQFPNTSGTLALRSDIPSLAGYWQYSDTVSTLATQYWTSASFIPLSSYNTLNKNLENSDLAPTADRSVYFGDHSMDLQGSNWEVVGNNSGLSLISGDSTGLSVYASATGVYPVRFKTDSLSKLVRLQIPDTSGVISVSVNGIFANKKGNITLPSLPPTGAATGDLSGTYPGPNVVDDSHNHTIATLTGIQDSLNHKISDTAYNALNQNFGNTNLTATGNRTHAFGSNSLSLTGNNWGVDANTSVLGLTSTSTLGIGLKASATTTGTALLKTDSLPSGTRTYQFPNNSGTLALRSDISSLTWQQAMTNGNHTSTDLILDSAAVVTNFVTAANGSARKDIENPGGALYSSPSSNPGTGALVFKHAQIANTFLNATIGLVWWNGSLSAANIRGYTNIKASAYWTGSDWAMKGALQTGGLGNSGEIDSVRIAFDASGNICIIIGSVANTWSGSYLKANIEKLSLGFTGSANTAWESGWTAVLESSLATYTNVTSLSPKRYIANVTGTSNKIDVTPATGSLEPIITISPTYAGQSSITTLGTVGTGTWNGTTITKVDSSLFQTKYRSDTARTNVYAAIATKEPAVSPGTTSQYYRGDKTWQTLPNFALADSSIWQTKYSSDTARTNTYAAIASKEPTITAGTTGQYWRGDKTWQTINWLTGNQSITWTGSGDVTGTASGATSISPALTIANNAVTNAKAADMATQTFKGRTTAGTGDPEDLTVSQAKTMLGLSGTNTGDQTITLTGDVTGSGTGSFATAIAAGAIVNADINASAAIAHSKMAALTASRAMVTDASGFASASSVTATELGYSSGVTSSIQTQINGKEPAITLLPVSKGGTGIGTLTGVTVGNGTSAFSAVAGTANQLLRRNSANTAYEFFTPSYVNAATDQWPLQRLYGSGTSRYNTITANDTRTVNTLPGALYGGATIEFKNGSDIGATGTYVSVLTMNNFTDNSAYTGVGQMGFNNNGVWYRSAVDNSTWGTTVQIADRTWASANLSPLTGGAGYIQNQTTSGQTASSWITGNYKGAGFAGPTGNLLLPQSDHWRVSANDGSPSKLKSGGLVISDDFIDEPPSDFGLYVKEQSEFASNVDIAGTGTAAHLVASTDLKTNMIMPYSGGSTTFSGDAILSTVTSSVLKSDVTGKIVGATPGTDYVTPASLNVSGSYTPTLTNAGTGTVTPQGFTYLRNGNVIHVMGRILCTGLTTGGQIISITLPVPSAMSNSYDLIGLANGSGLSSAANVVTADAAADEALLNFFTSGTTATVYVSFQYEKQ